MKNNLKIQKHFFLIIPLIIFLFYGSLPLQAAELFVDINNAACDNNTADSSVTPYCAIQEAIDAAAPGDTLEVAEGRYDERITINKNLTVIGSGQDLTILDGRREGRVVTIQGNEEALNVTLSDMTVENGSVAGNGAGLYSYSSNVILKNMLFHRNRATGEGAGGAINNSVGTMSISSCTIKSNISDMMAGGIYNSGTMTIDQTTIEQNNAFANGGGIVNTYPGSSLHITNSTLKSNGAATIGGAIDNRTPDATVEITKTAIETNSARFAGGGIANSGTMTLSEVSFEGNRVMQSHYEQAPEGEPAPLPEGEPAPQAPTSAGNLLPLNAPGGPLLAQAGPAAAMPKGQGRGDPEADLEAGPEAEPAGGGAIHNRRGTLDIEKSSFTNNTTSFGGGAIANLEGVVTIRTSYFYLNKSLSLEIGGGAIYGEGNSTTNVFNVTLSGNVAVNSGGAILTDDNGTIVVKNATITLNQSDADADGNGGGGGIAHINGTLEIINTIVAGNIGENGSPDCAGTIVPRGNNIIQIISGCTFEEETGNNLEVDPLLDSSPSENGGPTLTYALLVGSPAIDTGYQEACTNFKIDQRGYVRSVDGNGDGTIICDIGAFEFGSEKYIELEKTEEEKVEAEGAESESQEGKTEDGESGAGGEGGGGGAPIIETTGRPFADAPEDPTEDPFTPEDLLAEDPDESSGGCSLARHFNEKQNIFFAFLLFAPLMLFLIRVKSLRCEGKREVRRKGRYGRYEK